MNNNFSLTFNCSTDRVSSSWQSRTRQRYASCSAIGDLSHSNYSSGAVLRKKDRCFSNDRVLIRCKNKKKKILSFVFLFLTGSEENTIEPYPLRLLHTSSKRGMLTPGGLQ
jgi:hypothetical protein